MIEFLILYLLFNNTILRRSKLIPLPPIHLMTKSPEIPKKNKKNNKKNFNEQK